MKKGARKPPSRKGRQVKKSKKLTPGNILKYSFLVLLAAFLLAAAWQYKNGLLYYLGFKTNKRIESLTKAKGKHGIEDIRTYEILSRHRKKAFGLDVSHYQGKIGWEALGKNNPELPFRFVFIRATAGCRKDSRFRENWEKSKKANFIRGAYHYYRPDENSLQQADNFIKKVKLQKGDLPPVLDIEKIPNEQSVENLKIGLKRWLDKVEKHYGVKPIIYSGESFYTDFLKKEFEGYQLWIANYSFFEEEIRKEWLFWQFTDKASVKGIDGAVDINIYNGSPEELNEILVKN